MSDPRDGETAEIPRDPPKETSGEIRSAVPTTLGHSSNDVACPTHPRPWPHVMQPVQLLRRVDPLDPSLDEDAPAPVPLVVDLVDLERDQ